MKQLNEIFSKIYEKDIWGGGSGYGSDPEYAKVYIEYIQGLLSTMKNPVVLDIGCGDGRIASQFVDKCFHYIGVDVTTRAFDKNPLYGAPRTAFLAVNVTDPNSLFYLHNTFGFNVILIKDVLMHLTDDEIESVLIQTDLIPYDTMIVTNDYKNMRLKVQPEKRNPRGNRYSWAPISANHPSFAKRKPEIVGYFPRSKKKQMLKFTLQSKQDAL